MKKIIVIIGIILALILTSASIGAYLLYRQPGMRFLLIMSDIVKPATCEVKEITVRVKNKEVAVMRYVPAGARPGAYYFFLHGLTPESYRHPTIHKIALAISQLTGRTVLIPHITGGISEKRTIRDATIEIGDIYMTLRRTFPGSYHAFGACIAGTGLLVSFRDIPVEDYPSKLFLYGPFLDGRWLTDYYNSAGIEVDYMVRMAVALNGDGFTREEKNIIGKAIAASKPGTTDRAEMKKILGDALYRKVEENKFRHGEFSAVNAGTIFTAGKKFPASSFYIIHSHSDNIIPYASGLNLHKFLLSCGLKSRFVGTDIFAHTGKNRSPANLYADFKGLLDLLNELFSEE